ncbi:MAG: hypothetical protein WA003_14565, partial [Desulfuromonadaceae bacterium]
MQESNPRLSTYSTTSFKKWLPVLGWALVYLLVAGGLQYYISYPIDGDTAYHFAVGQLIREHGILYSFPWTPFSWLANHYADKELLFHLLFFPFAKLDYVTAARCVGSLAGATILFTLYMVLRSEKVKFAAIWALVPMVASVTFVYRFALVRPHLLSITLALVFAWAATRRRLMILAVVSVLYPLSYVAFWQIPLIILVAVEMARLLSGEKIQWRPAAVALAGIAFGIAIHPNTVNLIRLNWIQMANVLFQNAWDAKESIDLGTEFLPPSFLKWQKKLLIAVLMAFTGLLIAWRNRRENNVPLAFALTAIVFCVLTSSTERFVEYFVPFSAISLALVSRYVRWRLLLPGVLCVSLLYSGLWGLGTLVGLSKRGNDMPASLSLKLQQLVPPGSQVFTP